MTPSDFTSYCDYLNQVMSRNLKHDDHQTVVRFDVLYELMKRAGVDMSAVRVPAKTREIVG